MSTKLYNKIKNGYINSKFFNYFGKNIKIIKKLSLLKDIFFGIYTISFVFFVIFLFAPYYLLRYFNVLITNNDLLIISNLDLALFGLFLFSFSFFLMLYFIFKKYNLYLKFLNDDDME